MARWTYAGEYARGCSKCKVLQTLKIDQQRRVPWNPWACECGRSDQPEGSGAGKSPRVPGEFTGLGYLLPAIRQSNQPTRETR